MVIKILDFRLLCDYPPQSHALEEGRTDGWRQRGGGLPESENMSAASSDHFETLLRANLLRLYLSPISPRHGLGGQKWMFSVRVRACVLQQLYVV